MDELLETAQVRALLEEYYLDFVRPSSALPGTKDLRSRYFPPDKHPTLHCIPLRMRDMVIC